MKAKCWRGSHEEMEKIEVEAAGRPFFCAGKEKTTKKI
jgi:hypothetical protein